MPKAKLTKRIVDAFTCPAEQLRVALFDAEVPGFHVEVLRSGKKVYRFQWKRHGRQGRETIGEHGPFTVEKARVRALQMRANLSGGANPQDTRREAEAERRRTLTVAELIELWLVEGRAANPKKRESSWTTDARKLRTHIVPLLGKLEARKLTRHDVENAQQNICDGLTQQDKKTGYRGRSIVRGGRGAARSAIMSLSACCSWAVDRDLIENNPVLRVKKEKPRKRDRFLSGDEATRLLGTLTTMEAEGSLDDRFGDIIRLLLLTGARKMEIQALAWSEVRLNHRVIVLPRERSKTGERVISLNKPAVSILSARVKEFEKARARELAKPESGRREPSAFVFPSSLTESHVEGLQKVWERVRARASLADVRLHDLRHSFASFAAAEGASLLLIGKALGHTQAQTTERYAHLADNPIKAMVERVGETILSARKTKKTASPTNAAKKARLLRGN